MTCAEFRELAALYVAGALDREELAAAEAHLRDPAHEGCLEELRQLSAGVEVLVRALEPVAPPPQLWERIEAAVSPVPLRRRPAVREWLGWAVAAALALAVGAGALRGSRERAHTEAALQARAAAAAQASRERAACASELQALRDGAELQRSALLLLQTPGTQVVALAGPQGGAGSGRALINLQQKKGMILTGSLRPQAGRDYELWLIRGDQKIPAGLLHAEASGWALAAIDPQLLASAPDAVAVTLEPEGGGPQPRGPIVLVGATHT